MKRVTAILLCLILCLGVVMLAACNGEGSGEPNDPNQGQQAHVHTFKTDADWSKDASGHWYDATCDCADVTVRKLQHVDDNKDAICDVCKFVYDHEHTYAEDWTADCTNHWYTANCGCIIAGDQVGAHADENGDGECDVCSYVIEDLHNHYFATEWSSDAENHWHAALCEHGVEVADKAAHNINDAGYCTVCDAKVKEVDRTDILAVLKAAVANNYKVVSGNVIFDEIVYDTPTAILNKGRDEVFFVLGKEDSYILLKNYNMQGTFIGGEQQYFETLDNGEVFGIMMPIGSIDLAITQGVPEKLSGYNYNPGSILSAGYDDTSTLAQTIANFYDLMKTHTDVKDIVETYDPETGKYYFSFECLQVDATEQHPSDGSGGEAIMDYQAYVYFVEIEFSVNDDFVIDLCDFSVTSYRNWEGDPDIVYYPETNTYEMLDTASATVYAYSVSQASGERTFTTIYPKASFVPYDFELFHVTGTDYDDDAHLVITDEVEILDTDGDGIVDLVLDPYTFVRLHIGSVIPSTAIPSFMDTPVVTYENLNGSGTPWGKAENFQAPSFTSYMNAISFYTIDSGEYMFTITTGSVEKKIHVTITGEPAPDVSNDTATDFHIKISDIDLYIHEHTFVAEQAGIYTFNLPAGLGFSSQSTVFTAPGVSYTENTEGATVTIECWAGREITYYLASATRGWFHITVDYEAADIQKPGDPSEKLTGVYDATAGAETATLTIDGANKTIVFVHNKGTVNYTFTFDGGVFVLNNAYGPISASMAQYFGILTLDDNNLPVSFTYNAKVYTLTLQGAEPEPDPDPTPDPDEPTDQLQGSGTENDPYVLDELGDYTADHKGGANLVWYAYTAKANGYLTVSSSYSAPWIKIGTVISSAADNEGNGGLTTYVKANTTIYIGVGNWNELPAKVDFTASFQAFESDDFSALAGTWYGKGVSAYGTQVLYTLVINADGTGTLTYNDGFGDSEREIEYIVLDGEALTIGFVSQYESGKIECSYDGTTFACTNGLYKTSCVFQTTPIEDGGDDEGGEGDDPQDPESDPLKQAVCGDYPDLLDGYKVYIYNSDVYVVNVAKENDDGEYIVDLYFTFDVVDNGDGTYTLTLTHYPVSYEKGTEHIASIVANDLVVTPPAPPQKTTLELLESTIFDNGEFNGYNASFSYDYDAWTYFFNVYGGSADLYYFADVVENLDGTVSLTLTLCTDHWSYWGNAVTDVYELDGKTVLVSYDGENWTFTVEGEEPPAEPDGSDANPFEFVMGENSLLYKGYNYGWAFYKYTATEAGTLVITMTSSNYDLGYGPGAMRIAGSQASPLSIVLEAGETVWVGISTRSGSSSDTPITFTAEFTVGGEEGDDLGDGIREVDLVIGNNNINAENINFNYTATEDVKLSIVLGNQIMDEVLVSYTINDGASVSIADGASVEIELKAGDVLVISATTEGGYQSVTVAIVTDAQEGPTLSGSGTSADPYVITELPFEISFSGKFDKYYKYVATEDGVIVIHYTDGALVSDLPSDYVKDAVNLTYTITVKAGDVLKLNLWTSRTTGEFTYKIEVGELAPEPEVPEQPDPEQPGQGGEGSGEIDGTYVCDHTGSGTSVSIVFTNCTATEGTVAITRVSSWGSVTTYNCTYTIDATGRGTLAEINGGGTPYGAFFMFDADGKPLTYTYSGTEYVLEKQ